ncbi:MAG: LEA type 2 family protein [Treponema sp.]|nr:LEA type 2 family protein [Treponema sp.]
MRKIYIIFIIVVFIFLSCKTPPAAVEPAIIEIIEPGFTVTSIYIIQADIVVTAFEAVIKIDNPNDFAVELSSITYELFGNNRFWAGGRAGNIQQIPANTSGETRFTFEMNFINMPRQLLDDVIAMRQVNYRFKGQAEVRPVVIGASAFKTDFDCSGLSEVKRR